MRRVEKVKKVEFQDKLKTMSVQELLVEAHRVQAEMKRQSAESLYKLDSIKLEMMARQVTA
jgi:hypothetical protein